ncbi:MAG: hypothetical protein CSB16_01640 [Clostridiales bacterium]|nr:MAG: hypothetical protein CSB16_01640 [Clostridiales bacterium]
MKKIKHLEFLPIIVITILFYLLMSNLSLIKSAIIVLRPLIWGVVISYLMNPFAILIMKKFRWKWNISILFAYLVLSILVVLFFLWLVPILSENISAFIDKSPYFISELTNSLENIRNDLTKAFGNINFIDLSSIFDKITEVLSNSVTYVSNSFVHMLKGLLQIFLGIVISIYVLISKDRIKETSSRFIRVSMSEERYTKTINFFKKADRKFSNFLVGKLIDSVIIGIIAFIGFMFLKVPFAPLMALIVGLTNIIPYFGPIIGGIPVAIISFLVNPYMGVWTALFILALQQLDGYVIGPKILGDSLGISAFWVIIGVVIGGGLFGFIGMVMGVPTIAIAHEEFKLYISNREKKLGIKN